MYISISSPYIDGLLDIMPAATSYIGAAIKEAREAAAISQRELSAKSGVPQAQISKFENGVVDLRLSSLVSIARALGLEMELVPRKALPAVHAIMRGADAAAKPAYSLDDEDDA
jgi:transcriptional regulator with XRE-family HTH domain